ncbi:hypothetical protein CRG98_029775, partial [Punica granatum]
YNPLERREACKGGKEASKKAAASQSSVRSSTAALKSQPAHNARRSDAPVSSTNPPPKAPKPAYTVPAYDEQITELKLSVDSLEKERDFYFAKLRDIEIVCQCPQVESLPIVGAIKKILYAADDDASIVAEAQAMISFPQKEADLLSPIEEVPEERQSSETQKRKVIVNHDVEAASATTSSPRMRLSDASDVRCSGSPLMTY